MADPAALNAASRDPARCAAFPAGLTVDPRAPFVPEHRTQLYYTQVYASLHYEHRLRYNQLFGLRINEYVMMLEEELTDRLLLPLLRRPQTQADPALSEAVEHIRREEDHHFRMFARLNRLARPDLYPKGRDRFFSILPWQGRAMFHLAGALSRWFSFALWYVIAMEEASLALARETAGQPETETLGRIDGGFAALYREHARDEERHLAVEGLLIGQALASAPPALRRADAALFVRMMRGVTRPTRGGSGVKVIRQLVRDMPELRDREEEMIAAVLALADNRAFQHSLFNRETMPVAFGWYDRIPELAGLEQRMPGHAR